MSLFRSQEMGLYVLNIEKDFAWDVMETIGRCSCLQFIDANKSVHIRDRTYQNMIQRCDHACNKIKFVEHMCEKYAIHLVPPQSVDNFLENLQRELIVKGLDAMAYFEGVEQQLADIEHFLTNQRKKAEETYDRCIQLAEQRYVLNKAAEVVLSRAR